MATGRVSNILRRAIVISLSALVMSSTAYAVEGTAQEFLDKYKHADVTERQTLLVLIKGLENGDFQKVGGTRFQQRSDCKISLL